MAEPIAPWKSLNSAQRIAAEHTQGPLLILAGAGTGKTRVITARISYLLHLGIDPSEIVSVTFTNKAANEMRERVAMIVDKKDAKRLTLCTFHSLCVRILRRSIELLGYKRNFTIYTQGDQSGLIRRVINRKAAKDERMEPGVALSLISQAKNKGIPISPQADSLIAEVYREYTEDLKALNAVDFDDLLLLAVKLLEEHPSVRDEWRQRFNYLMVDEFQDTNSLQMRLLQLLTNQNHNVCVVGDDDQSIYGWRGAEMSNILEFERFFPNPVIVKLEENYRSTTAILETANHLIRHNLSRRDKHLWSQNKGDDHIRLIAIPGDIEEAEFIVNEMWESNRLHGKPWEDFAILFRMNQQSRVFEQTMREKKIPYRLIGGQSFFDRREIKDLLAYLTILCNPDDDINLLRVINTPPRGIGKGAIALATEQSIEWKRSIYATIKDPAFLAQLGARARKSLLDFIKWMEYYGDAVISRSADYAGLTERLFEDIGYRDYLLKSCKTDQEKTARQQAIAEFLQGLRDHQKKNTEGLRAYLDAVALLAENNDGDDIESKKGVCLITLHAAKGLEFPEVYLVGVEEGILPHSRSLQEGTREEERRLLYVGVTRAKQKLTISYCSSRKRYGERAPCLPSSFLKELGKQYVEEISYDEWASEPMDDEAAKSSFAMMREMLKDVEGFSAD